LCVCNWHAGMFSRLWSIVFEMSLHSLTIMNDRFWTVFSIDDGGQAKLVNSFCQLVIQNILLCLPLSQQFSKGKKNHFSDIWISNFITFLTFSLSFSFLRWHNKVIKNKECFSTVYSENLNWLHSIIFNVAFSLSFPVRRFRFVAFSIDHPRCFTDLSELRPFVRLFSIINSNRLSLFVFPFSFSSSLQLFLPDALTGFAF
jgi:hypothetical protein